MGFLQPIIDWLQGNWVQLGVTLWLIEQAMRAISRITPWEWDDNLVDVLADILSKIFPHKKAE